MSFISCVTYLRRPLLERNADLFHEAISSVSDRTPFEIIAQVLMPDHFHLVIDPSKGDFASIMQRLKMSFGMRFRSRYRQSCGRIWQHRYWDHLIRDQQDMNRHVDYIHYNPVKHGVVSSPFDWKHSSIHTHREQGCYQEDWGVKETLTFEGEFGE